MGQGQVVALGLEPGPAFVTYYLLKERRTC
jgi:hypothetical protein